MNPMLWRVRAYSGAGISQDRDKRIGVFFHDRAIEIQ